MRHASAIVPVLRTSHFARQLAAAKAGLGAVVTAHPFKVTGLVEIAHTRALDRAWSELPSGTMWLVGHRALRHDPRVGAVWSFLLETFQDAPASPRAHATPRRSRLRS